jgi:hypothetical protein
MRESLGMMALLAMALISCRSEPSDGAERQRLDQEVEKLQFVRAISDSWYVDYGMESEGLWYPRLKPDDNGNRDAFPPGLAPGDLFFESEGPMKHRFKFIGFESKERTDQGPEVGDSTRIALFEDQKEGKRGKVYRIERGLARARIPYFIHRDWTAVLAFPEGSNQPASEFEVDEGLRFSLPPGKGERRFLLRKVTEEEVRIEWEINGVVRGRTLSKEPGESD